MENIKVGDKAFTNGCGDYEVKLEAIVRVNNKSVYVFNDTGSDYIRAYFQDDVESHFCKEKKVAEPEVEELTVSEISEKLGKKIKVVAEKLKNSDSIPF